MFTTHICIFTWGIAIFILEPLINLAEWLAQTYGNFKIIYFTYSLIHWSLWWDELQCEKVLIYASKMNAERVLWNCILRFSVFPMMKLICATGWGRNMCQKQTITTNLLYFQYNTFLCALTVNDSNCELCFSCFPMDCGIDCS